MQSKTSTIHIEVEFGSLPLAFLPESCYVRNHWRFLLPLFLASYYSREGFVITFLQFFMHLLPRGALRAEVLRKEVLHLFFSIFLFALSIGGYLTTESSFSLSVWYAEEFQDFPPRTHMHIDNARYHDMGNMQVLS
jgi:hypothetical protein